MLTGKSVLILAQNELLGLGLKTVLAESFSPDRVEIVDRLDARTDDSMIAYFFVTPDQYIANHSRLQSVLQRVVVLSENGSIETTDGNARVLDISQGQSEIVDQLQRIFRQDERNKSVRSQEKLSSREIEVLKLVAKGLINKHIADQLSISLHTVISHRQNITRKLGIKTVSGLTMYALLNGLISSKDIR